MRMVCKRGRKKENNTYEIPRQPPSVLHVRRPVLLAPRLYRLLSLTTLGGCPVATATAEVKSVDEEYEEREEVEGRSGGQLA